MKKVMLILMVLGVFAGCTIADKPETKTEIKVGQVWKWGDYDLSKKVLEVGEKYVVWHYIKDNGEIAPKVETHGGFKREWKLVEQVSAVIIDENGVTGDAGGLTWYYNEIKKETPQSKKKPHLHKNPNNDHWICSRHGDLDKDKGLAIVLWCSKIEINGMLYCHECYWEAQNKLLNQHITGVKEND